MVILKNKGVAMLKGYRTYLAIILSALIVLANFFGLIDKETMTTLVGLLSAFGLYTNSLRTHKE